MEYTYEEKIETPFLLTLLNIKDEAQMLTGAEFENKNIASDSFTKLELEKEENDISGKIFATTSINTESKLIVLMSNLEENIPADTAPYIVENLYPKHLEVPVKIETKEYTKEVEQTSEILYEEWKIKNEEIDLKEEDLKQNPTIMTFGGIDQEHRDEYNKYRCSMCQFQSSLNTNAVQREFYKFTGNYCKYHQATQKMYLVQHTNIKKVDASDKFKCDECEYQTLTKGNLKRHVLGRHKNIEEADASDKFKCAQCEYQTIEEGKLKQHMLRHKNIEEVDASKKFKCGECEYRTLDKSCLKRHILRRHKNIEEVDDSDKFKCGQCEYQTFEKGKLKRHILRHKNIEEVDASDKFKCDQCEYQTLRRSDLKRHILGRHKNIQEVNDSDKFKCGECDYQTLTKYSLKTHMQRHKNIEKVDASDKLKCDQWDYQTLMRTYLKRNILRRHKNI